MKQKKTQRTLAGILAMVLMLVSMPANAISPNLNSRYGSGYYPAVYTPAKFYSWFLGGSRASALAQLSYGSVQTNLTIRIDEVCSFNPRTNKFSEEKNKFVHGNGTVEYTYSLSIGQLADNVRIEHIEASFFIGPLRIADKRRSS